MDDKKNAWRNFEKTGSIEDYFAYKFSKKRNDEKRKDIKDLDKRI